LAGINEIKVNTPTPENPDLKALIDDLDTKENSAEKSINELYYRVFWYSDDISASTDINATVEMRVKFGELLKSMTENGVEIDDYVIKWVKSFKTIPKNAYYVFNPYNFNASYKFTKIDDNTLSILLPNHWTDEFPTMKWNSLGKLVPNN
jgi:hypothetical protein